MDNNIRMNLQILVDSSTTRINYLKSQRKIYDNMRNKLKDEVLPKLKAGKNCINDAKTNLNNNYSSTEATKKCHNLQAYSDKVNSIINKLNQTILIEINKAITAIDQEIASEEKSKQKAIDRLNKE